MIGLIITSSAQQNVTIAENKQAGTLEIRNGLLGIIVPSSKTFIKGKSCLAPIQSFIYRNGVFSDNTANFLKTRFPVESMITSVTMNTSTRAVVQVEYRFMHESKKYYYTCNVKVNSGEKAIIIEEEITADISYSVKISNGLKPDKARYRGWNSEGLKYGYEPSGAVYQSEDVRQYPLDATLDLHYDQPFSYPRLILWEPAGGEACSGRYWQLYNNNASENSNLFGFFQGQASRLINARSVGPNLKVEPTDKLSDEKEDAEIEETIELRGPDDITLPRKRFQWAAYIGTRKEIISPEKTQPIAIEMNRISGLGAVIKEYAARPVKIIPAFYNGAIYMDAQKIGALRDKVKTDKAFYTRLMQTDGGYKVLWDMWNFPQKGRDLVDSLIAYRKQLEANYVSGEGIYNRSIRYWKGSLGFKFYAIITSCLFADKTIKISSTEKLQLEELIGMMARILWNDNNVPLFDSAGVNFGPANMVYQYRNNGRYFFALLLKDDPEFAGRAKQVAKDVNNDIEYAFADNGASFGSPHYIQATIDPLLFSVLQLKQAGIVDYFKKNEKIKLFARFYLSLLTPPSPRFAGNRKLISFGDGSEESSAIFAMLAEGFNDVDTALSKELMAAYNYGPPMSSMHGILRLAADLTKTYNNKSIFPATANYSGYLTHFRSAINTTRETAIWMLNGELFSDHRNDDAGETAIYALGTPLSLSRSSFYYPSATDSRIRSVVVPEKLFPEWNGNEQPIAGRSLTNRTWPSSSLLEFVSLGYSSSSKVLMKTVDGNEWYRHLIMIDLPGNNPVIIYYDSVKGNNPNIWSMLMMSEGPVATPAGNILPEKRIYSSADLKQLPAGTAVKAIAPGLNRFAFTGQQWISHITNGINWYLYSLSDNSIDFSLANWTTTWQNNNEKKDFLITNHRNYSEEQQIIRLKSTKPFFTLLLPYFKGSDVYASAVEKINGNSGFRITLKNQELIINKTGYYMKDDKKTVLTLWNGEKQIENSGYSISGGCAEIENIGGKFIVHLHGNAGRRTITCPFPIRPVNQFKEVTVKSVTGGASSITIDYSIAPQDNSIGGNTYREYVFIAQQ